MIGIKFYQYENSPAHLLANPLTAVSGYWPLNVILLFDLIDAGPSLYYLLFPLLLILFLYYRLA